MSFANYSFLHKTNSLKNKTENNLDLDSSQNNLKDSKLCLTTDIINKNIFIKLKMDATINLRTELTKLLKEPNHKSQPITCYIRLYNTIPDGANYIEAQDNLKQLFRVPENQWVK